jgi:molecular chaperone GrpE (heat shock protein)
MAEQGTILDRSLAQLGITQPGAEAAPVETPAETVGNEVETPAPADNEAQSIPEAAPPAPEGQDSQGEIKRLEKIAHDNQAAYTRSQQELADLRRKASDYERRLSQITPAEMAVAQVAQSEKSTETEGQTALRKLIEQSPELMDDPQKQVKLMGQISTNTTLQLLKDYDAMKAYAAEAKQVLGNDFDPVVYEADAWEAYQIHRRLGKTGNPFLTAVSVINQDVLKNKLAAIPQKEAEVAAREVAQRSSVRMERPGNPVNGVGAPRVRLSDEDYCKTLITNSPDFKSFSRK